MTWTSGEIIVASRLEDKNDKNAPNGYAGTGISGRIEFNQTNLNVILSEDKKKLFTSFVSGTSIYHSHDTPTNMIGSTPTKLKTITLGYLPNTSLIIYYETKPLDAYGNLTYIYRNGIDVGTEQATAGNGNIYQDYTETISGWAATNTLELWGRSTGVAASCSVCNFRILGTATGIINS